MDGAEEARMDGVGTGKLEWIGEEWWSWNGWD